MSKNLQNWRKELILTEKIFISYEQLLMTFSGKMWLIILKKKKQGLILSQKNKFLEKPDGECQTEQPSFLRIKTLT